MTKVTIIGGSGYAGAHIAEAAAVRGLDVHSVSRSEVAEQIRDVSYRQGDFTDATDRAQIIAEADVVVVAVSPRGNMQGKVRPTIALLAAEAAAAGVRLGVIGGSGSLLQFEGGPRVVDSDDFAEAVKPEALEMSDVLDDLRATPESLDWFYASPAEAFGPWAAGSYRGEYRIGGDVILRDDDGKSDISGADFGVAIAEEIENPEHRRERFTVAY